MIVKRGVPPATWRTVHGGWNAMDAFGVFKVTAFRLPATEYGVETVR